MKKSEALPEQAAGVLTEDSVKEIETAIEEKIQLSVEAALTNQDELYSEKLEEVLINHFNKKIKVIITVDKISTSPALEKRAQKAELMENIESAIMQDSLVKELISDFNAEIIPSSIEPIKKGK